jgi:methyltransferase (TIGR00027 family)
MSALGIAVVRAIESEKPEGVRICYDPFARKFISGFLFQLVRFFDRIGYGDLRGPGVMGFLAARERHIDEHLTAWLKESPPDGGERQLVILGAGFDARAYRFQADLIDEVKVFEVDHPATQNAKKEKLNRVLGSLPEHVVYVPIDFNTQALADRLHECGYSDHLTTLFIWQGVTQYLTPAAVDSTLAFVVHHSAPGSSIIFDYMYTSLLDGTVKHGEVSKLQRERWMSGESLSFGIPEGTIEGFLEPRGFTRVQNASCTALHAAYFQGPNQGRKVADGYAIVSARTAPSLP